MLKECLDSMVRQDFPDVEILVGNDCVEDPIDLGELGVSDPRISIINRPVNLGERENMNDLFRRSSSRYFTWLADDDALLPGYFQGVSDAVAGHPGIECIFPTHVYGDDPGKADVSGPVSLEIVTGAEWLKRYLSRSVRVHGCYGVFRREYLLRTGAIPDYGIAATCPYADNLLAIRPGLLDKVGIIPRPLIFYRTHDESVSNISSDIQIYVRAQEALVRQAVAIISRDELKAEFDVFMDLLLRWCLRDFRSVAKRCGGTRSRVIWRYMGFLRANMTKMKKGRAQFTWQVGKSISKLIAWQLMSGKMRSAK